MTNDNMKLWNAVEKTDPNYTKHVSQRGGFTAISANYQIMQATKQFGSIGIGWGYIAGDPIFHETLIYIPVTLWHGDRSNTFGPMLGCEEWKDRNGRVDSDASKKATTDAITKLLSQLGFSADVFLGKYDDQKYVEALREEFTEKPPMIDQTQRGIIIDLTKAAGMDIVTVCQKSKIKKIDDLPADKFDAVEKWLGTKIDELNIDKATKEAA
jgi:hypothetical protein